MAERPTGDTVRLLLATYADLDRLKAIRHAAFATHAPSAYTATEVENLLADLDESELVGMVTAHQLFVAAITEEVVGLAGWRGTNLRHVYVAPGRERSGIGSRLVAQVEQDLRRRTGASEIWVNSVLYARGFYEANGYRLRTTGRAWDGSRYLRMVKTL